MSKKIKQVSITIPDFYVIESEMAEAKKVIKDVLKEKKKK